MISLKKYLDAPNASSVETEETDPRDLAAEAVAAYRSALREMGTCSLDACPALGEGLKQGLGKLEANLANDPTIEIVQSSERSVQEQLQNWGRQTARHYRKQTGEVKELLIVMARTAESVGERDQRCAAQINEVTTRLERIASLEDLTQIRASIEKSATELKTSIDRMSAEGKAAIEELRAEVTSYQARLEEAEHIASRDSLTGLGSRLWVESQIEYRIKARGPLCVAIIDIDGFKQVNDDNGHIIGDDILKQFATELKSASRTTDMIGRWGGDEFIVLLDCGLARAKTQIDRLREWVCGNYTVHGKSGPRKLRIDASIGLAEYRRGETIKDLLDRADAAMYQNKTASRTEEAVSKR